MTNSTHPTFGAYRVTSLLGSGALSTVYKAVQEPLGRTVAVKALKPSIAASSPFAAQLEREARVLGELCHPNIVLLHDFVKDEKGMYLVVEHVDGWSLADVLAKRPRLGPELVAAIGCQIARALGHAHERGIVHRDVKPANVLVSRRGEVKIVDFGIAQRDRLPSADILLSAADAASTDSRVEGRADSRDSNAAFGTPAYMSPEQILGETVDARSDLFSLGVLFYQLLSGVRPFDSGEARDKRAASQRIRRDPPTPLRTRAPDVPRAVERVVMRLLEKLPDDRYRSAEEVVLRLEDYVRSRTREGMAAVVARGLSELGLIASRRGPSPAALLGVSEPRAGSRLTVLALAGVGLFFVLAGAAIQWQTWGVQDFANAGAAPLALIPPHPGAIRVLATPWAEIAVDGQHVDVTPFARPIPVSAGTHYVTFTHPSARPEKRVVEVKAGATVLIDVTMNLGEDEGAIPKEAGL